MEAFKLLTSRNKIFIQVRYKAAFHFMNINSTSTVTNSLCALAPHLPSRTLVFSSIQWVGARQGLGWMVSEGFRVLEEPSRRSPQASRSRSPGAPRASLFSLPQLSSSGTLYLQHQTHLLLTPSLSSSGGWEGDELLLIVLLLHARPCACVSSSNPLRWIAL